MQCIALLRAINIAGHRTVRMDDLEEAFTAAGCRRGRGYIQSGGVLFQASTARAADLFPRARRHLRQRLRTENDILYSGPSAHLRALCGRRLSGDAPRTVE